MSITCFVHYTNGSLCLIVLDDVAHGRYSAVLLWKFNFGCLLKRKSNVLSTYDARVVR